MHVNDRRIADFLQPARGKLGFNGCKRIIERIHHHPPHHVHHQDLLAVCRGKQAAAAARRPGRIVYGPQQGRLAFNEDKRLTLVPGMIAQCHNVGAGIAQGAVDVFGDAKAAGRILAVDDNEIGFELVA